MATGLLDITTVVIVTDAPSAGAVGDAVTVVFVLPGVTVSVADAVAPGPALAEVSAEVTFWKTPVMTVVTLTEKVHSALAARVAPDRLTTAEFAVAVIVPPPHDPLSPFGVATTMPDGNVSVKARPDTAWSWSVFDSRNVSVEVAPKAIDLGLKVSAIVGVCGDDAEDDGHGGEVVGGVDGPDDAEGVGGAIEVVGHPSAPIARGACAVAMRATPVIVAATTATQATTRQICPV